MSLKAVVSYALSFCLFVTHISLPVVHVGSSIQDAVRVAFVGFHFEEITVDKQNEMDQNLFLLLDSEPRLYTIPMEIIHERLDEQLLTNLQTNPQAEDLQQAARLLDADHIFTGSLQNPSNDPQYTALVGDVIRYDSVDGQLYNLRIQSFYENFDTELTRIYTQLIQTIVPPEKKGFFRRYLPGVLIVAATAAAVIILVGGTDGQGTGEGPGPIAP